MLPAISTLLTFVLASPPVDLRAERLEVTRDGWRADAVELQTADLALTAARATGRRTAACADGAVSLVGPLRIDVPDAHLAARAGTLCLPSATATLTDVVVRGTRLRASANAARWADGVLEASDPSVTACGCNDPPWRVTASRATVVPGEGAWATWPVLRVGDLPILAAPVAYVPFARRRTGLLWPELGWHGTDGFTVRAPFFWAPIDAADLTLVPGWRTGRGLTLDGRLRWAADAIHTGRVEVWSAPWVTAADEPADLVAVGAGSVAAGPLVMAVDGQAASSMAAWGRHQRGFEQRARTHLFGTVGAAVTGGSLGAGARAVMIRRPGRLFADEPQRAADRTGFLAPTGWVRAGAQVGPMHLTLDADAARVLGVGPEREVLGLRLEATAVEWLGPLRIRPVVIAATRAHPAPNPDGAADDALAGMAGIEARVAIERRVLRLHHTMALTVDGRVAGGRPAERPLGPADRPLNARGVGVTLSTALIGPQWLARAALRLDYEATEVIDGVAPIGLRSRLQGPWAALSADAAWAPDGHAAHIDARLGPADGLHLDLGWLSFGRTPGLPWLRSTGLTLPVAAQSAWTKARTATAGVGLPIGRLILGWRGAYDADARSLVGQIATADWRGRCDCWSAGLWLGHEAGNPAPDVMLTVTLGR